ncbi:phosphoesterase [Limnoglobus roseus]|uniref:Phosphoesterase n=1 Tax=Limnoglobus roseus TaxID=2598579 RepID=A0A5C1AIB1_9BACT|nr:phosphoesterase [Limnoglobus roseus]QEL17993.1 phosphoesterase [Limnoglobus roseus]
MPTDERVLVIPTAHFQAVGSFQGYRRADESFRRSLLDLRVFSFQPRSVVETDPAFKQLIPYVILRCGDQLFHYRRGASGNEKRLQALRSVGIGGHISEDDAAGPADLYTNGMRRELAEEVTIDCHFTERLLGFINDDRTFVGSVHLGVVHLLELDAAAARSNEDALTETGFASESQLWDERGEFETWSQFAFEMLRAEV